MTLARTLNPNPLALALALDPGPLARNSNDELSDIFDKDDNGTISEQVSELSLHLIN